MKITGKREIIFERKRSITIKFVDESNLIICPSCETRARFLTVDEAAIIGSLAPREIFRLIEDGQLHSQETKKGNLLVCFASLAELKNKAQLSAPDESPGKF